MHFLRLGMHSLELFDECGAGAGLWSFCVRSGAHPLQLMSRGLELFDRCFAFPEISPTCIQLLFTGLGASCPVLCPESTGLALGGFGVWRGTLFVHPLHGLELLDGCLLFLSRVLSPLS